eukprot:1159846-Pelagomonas_calceolata.AAC.19
MVGPCSDNWVHSLDRSQLRPGPRNTHIHAWAPNLAGHTYKYKHTQQDLVLRLQSDAAIV